MRRRRRDHAGIGGDLVAKQIYAQASRAVSRAPADKPLEAMRGDLELPEHHGIYQAVGDTVGPGGIARALRNIPVLVGIAREMEQRCPSAWLINVTNPMTTLCRVRP